MRLWMNRNTCLYTNSVMLLGSLINGDPHGDTIMAQYVNATLALEPEDISDYRFLWNTMAWWSKPDRDGWLRNVW